MAQLTDLQKVYPDNQGCSSDHMTRPSSSVSSLDENLSLDDVQHLQTEMTAEMAAATELQRPTAKRRRIPLSRLEMLALACVLISMSVLKFCEAFPSPHVRASHFATRGNIEHGRQLNTRCVYSAVADNVQDFSRANVQSAGSKSKSLGFLTRLFRRRMDLKQTQSASAGTTADEREAVNRFWRRSVRELKSVAEQNRSNAKQIDTSSGNRFRPSPISSRQTNQLRTRQSATSTTNKLRISKLQSFASSPTALKMVLSTPESIIEQVSTEKLLDILIDESVRTSSREPIMMQFNPRRGWIWRQWRGTVFSETWKSGLLNMALATFVVFLYKMYPNLKDLLQGFSILWGQLLSVTTFTLTFFLNQSYGLWRKCYDYSRRLQGRLNDLGMTLAAHATRVAPSSPDIPSTYTPQSKQALELVSRYVRVFNLLTYASFTRSHRPILTPRGMRRLVERGILTPKEREILIDAEIPATQRHNAVLVWLIRLFLEGRQTGIFEGGYGFEEQFMEKCHVIRAQYGAIGDELQGRMPLAYAHIVQVLLDVVLWMYPFMALSTGMAWYIGVVGTGLLTMFYQGLFDLAKQFLDPYDNENYGKGEDPLVIDTLIAETNAGSVRWLNSFQQQPWSKQLLKDGEMYDSVLPLRGYSVEELMEKKAQEEAEQAERDRILKEKRLKEEIAERERAEELLKENFASYIQNRTASFVERSNGTATLSPRVEKVMPINSMNKTLLEVSGGEVVSTSSLFSSEARLSRNLTVSKDIEARESNNTEADNPLKIYTLEDGTLVTDKNGVPDNPELEAPVQTKNEVASDNDLVATAPPPEAANTLLQWASIGDKTPNFDNTITPVDSYLSSLSGGADQFAGGRSLYDIEDEEDADFSPFKIEWFDEVGPDGQEMRLSQMLADEDWSFLNEDDEKNKTMDYEEFTRKANELITQTENEIAETKEVLYSSPGSQADYDVTGKTATTLPPRQRVTLEETVPAYDQTKLDPISQLWGAPPDVLGKTMLREDEPEPKTINEGMDFANIYALWGTPIESKVVEEDDTDLISTPIDNIKQLWPDTRLADPESLAPIKYDPASEDSESAYSAFNGLEWWDTVSDDGKEIRLSMMLADEEYEEEIEQQQEKEPMTYEQFAMETENMIQMVEEERKETEAIMAAPPGADAPSEFDESEDDSASSVEIKDKEDILAEVVASEQFEKMVESLADEDAADEISQADYDEFAILEMDVDNTLPDAAAEEIVPSERARNEADTSG